MGCDNSTVEEFSYQVAFSGGGLRALQSAAVFRLAMEHSGIWQDVSQVSGVSGGGWFILSEQLREGKLNDVFKRSNGTSPPIPIDELLQILVDRNLVPVQDSQDLQVHRPQGAGLLRSLVSVTASLVQSQGRRNFGTGARIVEDAVKHGGNPMAEWSKHLDELLFRPPLDDDYGTGLDDGELLREYSQPQQESGQGEEKKKAPVYNLAMVSTELNSPKLHWEKVVLLQPAADDQRFSPSFELDMRQSAGHRLPAFMAAICGSAFAATPSFTLGGKSTKVSATTPILKNSSYRLPDGRHVYDAGLHCNVAITNKIHELGGGRSPPLLILDCSSSREMLGLGKHNDEVLNALVEQGYKAYNQQEKQDQGSFYNLHQIGSHKILKKGNHHVHLFSGIRDGETMEVVDQEHRLAELRALFDSLLPVLAQLQSAPRK